MRQTLGVIMIVVMVLLVGFAIRNDILNQRSEKAKQKTIDSVFARMDAINKESDIYTDSLSYWRSRLQANSYSESEYSKYLIFRDRNEVQSKIKDKEFWNLQLIFKKVQK